tara:strand:- start:4949 stop:5296 length:348 start_codon:yes stop_codon:yes gene_type:complete
MRYNIHEVLDILKPTRKESAKLKVWNVHLKNYSKELWEDVERIKNGLEPLQIITEVKEESENEKPTRLFFSINNEGVYDKYDVSILTDISTYEITAKTRRTHLTKNGFIIKRIKF